MNRLGALTSAALATLAAPPTAARGPEGAHGGAECAGGARHRMLIGPLLEPAGAG
jgi:hypothetical protein